MHRMPALLLLAFLLPSFVFAASGNGYRLAGVLAVGPDYMAILELPGGGQQLVRKGSTLDDGALVVLVDAQRLHITRAGRTIELNLDGSGRPAEVPLALGVLQEQSDYGGELVRRVDPAAFSASAAQAGKMAGSAPNRIGRRDPAAETGRRLAPILNLPPDSRVVEVNEQLVLSAEQAITLIEKSLTDGVSPRLNIASASGEARVYMSPAEP